MILFCCFLFEAWADSYKGYSRKILTWEGTEQYDQYEQYADATYLKNHTYGQSLPTPRFVHRLDAKIIHLETRWI